MDRRQFDFHISEIESERVRQSWAKLTISYIMFTLEDTLSDFDIEMDNSEFKDLCFKIYNDINFVEKIDMEIIDIVKKLKENKTNE